MDSVNTIKQDIQNQRMVNHSSRILLSQSALEQNLSFLRKKVGSEAIISSVVKANAYGHGIETFVPMAEECGIRHFAVASSHEASEVLDARTTDAAVTIMGILYDDDLHWVIEHEVEFFVFDMPRLKKALEVAQAVDKKALIHLEVETGGNRTGLPEEKLDEALQFLKKHVEHLRFKGFCTHFAGIETLANQFRIARQQQKFDELYNRVEEFGHLPELRHSACSAAALAFPDTVMDMVRVGTAQYGMWPSPDIYNMHLKQTNKLKDSSMKQLLTWKTDVMHIKQIKKDEFIGYGTSYQAPKDMITAVVPIGYSNGFAKALSNLGYVLIKGKKAPIVGLINMNVFMVDITDIAGVQVGDVVVLIGQQGEEKITIRSFSEFTKFINNEFVSRLPTAIPRETVS
jgi:alanine racemase